MDHDDDAIQSSSQPVTVAAVPPQQILTLALPIQQPRTTATASGATGGREDCWSEGATSALIDAWGERYLELSRGNLKQQHWKDVADIVSSREEDYTKPAKTDVQCKNRIDTLKKKYKLEKSKIESGQGPSKWVFFHRLDHLIGSLNAKITTTALHSKLPVGTRRPQQRSQKFRSLGSMDSDSSRSEDRVPSPDSTDSFPPETFNKKRQRSPPKLDRERLRPKLDRGTTNSNQANSIPVKADGGLQQKKNKGGGWGNSIRDLTRAITEFGGAYERAETSKVEQVVEMEKHRMKFAKELELQRMQFFMKTQLELTQLKHERRSGNSNNNNHHHHSSNNNRSSSD
ncbi:hypothetical protein GIB67_008994 [Kingdonia uniflora]|uniref:Myb/SANT-like DNA-binding domain-containing protein n=1 Tax=Kingdonia uniflora TaxID=39325 RepID=A0A7J7LVX1_9MAGN|nr:hypothetical protein GIB67_008994 [Kingdonia uniflora]